METERSGCTRVRFTKPDKEGNVKQYIEKQDPRDIELKDLSGMESLAKADELMQQWAYETFDGNNIPMCEFTMLKLPEGYNGFFFTYGSQTDRFLWTCSYDRRSVPIIYALQIWNSLSSGTGGF